MTRHVFRRHLRNANLLVLLGASFSCTYDYDQFHDADGGTSSQPTGGTHGGGASSQGGTTAVKDTSTLGGQSAVQSGGATSAAGGVTGQVDTTGSTAAGGGATSTSTTTSGTCTSGTVCSKTCVDLARDPLNCGTCGHFCPAGFTCESGNCACSAPSSCGELTGATCVAGLCHCAGVTCSTEQKCAQTKKELVCQ
jgi:hypothetical protein